MLKHRLITAAILIPIVIWLILYAPSALFLGFISLVVIIAAWEWAKICGWQTAIPRYSYAFIITLTLIIIYYILQQQLFDPTLWILAVASLWWLIAFIWVWQYQHDNEMLPKNQWVKAGLGFIILLPAWLALIELHQHNSGQSVMFLLILIWAADSGAYFAGKYFGKIKLADKVSPKKTWEGVLGGIIVSEIIAFIYAYFIVAMPSNILIIFMLLCVVIVFVSILGDLLESLFKRQMGIKDSSHILPGHGGVLDRIDSLTSAAPLFLLGTIALGMLF